MAKKVVLVGHCGPDSSYLRMAIQAAERQVQVTAAEDEESLRRCLSDGVDLVLLNRQLDYGFPETEGVDLIRRMKKEFPAARMMLVSNFPEAQAAAAAAGALSGFGKAELGSPRVNQLLKDVLAGQDVKA